jgi:hypothetical protein
MSPFNCLQGIRIVKCQLYQHLHSSSLEDWVSALPKINEDINNSPMEMLGLETPSSIQSGFDELQIRQAQHELASKMTEKQHEMIFPINKTYDDMVANDQEYRNT